MLEGREESKPIKSKSLQNLWEWILNNPRKFVATAGIKTNIDAVKEALRVYGLVVRKDADKEVRLKIADIAWRASEATYFSPKGKVRAEISNLPITKDGGKKRYGDTQYVGQYKLMNWERKLKGLPTLGGGKFRNINTTRPNSLVYTEKRKKLGGKLSGLGVKGNYYNMLGKYKAFIKHREDSTKFIRAAWAPAAEFFGKPFQRGRDFGPKAISRFTGKMYGGEVKSYGGDLTEYSMFNGAGKFDIRRKKPNSQTAPERSSADQARARGIIEVALEIGARKVLDGLTRYFEGRAQRFQRAMRVLNKFN